ncbi:MAG: cupin domain-containing protein [Acetobacteraceae bacterium]|nr:cupin domain-containing protein [Acetobacteraceae bacterium]
MLTRRWFAACAICAAGGLLAAEVGARAQSGGLTRTVLNKQEYPGDTMLTLQVLVEIEPNFLVAPHTHPGVESGTVLEGSSVLSVKDRPDRTVAVGDSFQIPYQVPHLIRNGPTRTRVVSTYVVEKDKPLASPAPE